MIEFILCGMFLFAFWAFMYYYHHWNRTSNKLLTRNDEIIKLINRVNDHKHDRDVLEDMIEILVKGQLCYIDKLLQFESELSPKWIEVIKEDKIWLHRFKESRLEVWKSMRPQKTQETANET